MTMAKKNSPFSGRSTFLTWFGQVKPLFSGRMRHKADRAALGLSCGVCFESPAAVFAGLGGIYLRSESA